MATGLRHQSGFGNQFPSKALPGTLPVPTQGRVDFVDGVHTVDARCADCRTPLADRFQP